MTIWILVITFAGYFNPSATAFTTEVSCRAQIAAYKADGLKQPMYCLPLTVPK